MLLFANSISKLSSVLGEKSESKSDWPKFSGDQKKFVRSLSICGQFTRN
jgi:hypothetical protein